MIGAEIDVKMKILIPKNKNWKKSVFFGSISLALLFLTIIVKPSTPGYAPHMFAYNMGFFLPMTFFSVGFGLAGLINYQRIEKSTRRKYKWIYRLIPILLIIPIGIRFLSVFINMIRILLIE